MKQKQYKPTTLPTLSDAIRRAILDAPKSMLQVARDSGISYSQIYGFANRKKTLSSRALDVLVEYFGLEIVKRKPS